MKIIHVIEKFHGLNLIVEEVEILDLRNLNFTSNNLVEVLIQGFLTLSCWYIRRHIFLNLSLSIRLIIL